MSHHITNLQMHIETQWSIDKVTMHSLLNNFLSISFIDFLPSCVYTYTDEKSGIHRKFKKNNYSKKIP